MLEGQRSTAEPTEPTPLSQADPAKRFQRAGPAEFPWRLAGPREWPLRHCHSFLYPTPKGFTHKTLHRYPIARLLSTPTPFKICHPIMPLEEGEDISNLPHLTKPYHTPKAVIPPHLNRALLPTPILTYSRMFLVFTAL